MTEHGPPLIQGFRLHLRWRVALRRDRISKKQRSIAIISQFQIKTIQAVTGRSTLKVIGPIGENLCNLWIIKKLCVLRASVAKTSLYFAWNYPGNRNPSIHVRSNQNDH